MTSIEMTVSSGEQGTWAGVTVALVVGIGGLIVGVISLIKAHQAKQTAETANEIAFAANSISVAANLLSEKANQISLQNAMRSAEEHDVDWQCGWRAPGIYVVTNSGRDSAIDVTVRVTVDLETVSIESEVIHHQGNVVLDFPGALKSWNEEEEKRLSFESQARSGLRLTAPALIIPPSFGNDHGIRDLILWKTRLGTPKSYDQQWLLSSLEP